MTHALLHAAILVAALPAARLVPVHVRPFVGVGSLAAAHWLWALWRPSHVALVLAALLFWSPLVRGRGGPAYVLAGLVIADTAGLALAIRGNAAGSVEMLAGMLPVAAAFVVVAWRRLAAEELDARAA